MQNSQRTSSRKASIRGFSGTQREEKVNSYRGNYTPHFMEERLFHLKIQTIIDELTEIMLFIKELERFWLENSEVMSHIHDILVRLRSEDKNYKYTKIVHVLTKYLSGIREFSSTTNMRGVIFYKRLFESTLVAIIRELDSLEEELC